MKAGSIIPVTGVELHLVRGAWRFADEHGAEIAAYWANLTAANATLFDGKVLKVRDARIEADVFQGEAFEADFSSFLYWRDRGFPDASVRNVFGSAVVHSADGDLVLGRMADWTSNAGLVYPFGGSLGPEDARNGKVDVASSIERELREETGLEVREASLAPGFLVIPDARRISLSQVITFPLSTAALVRRVEAFIAREERPELAGLHVVRSTDDILPQRMPGFTQAYIAHAFSR